MTVTELLAKRANVWENMKDFMDSHTDDSGLMSAEDAATYDKREKDLAAYDAQVTRLQNAAATESRLSSPMTEPIVGAPSASNEKTPGGFRASAQYAKDMLTAIRSDFRQISNVLSEGVDANGGYLVPEEWDRRLVVGLDGANVMRKLGTRIPTSGEHKINLAATKPAASWVEEGEALTFGDATFDQKTLDAHKLHVAVKVTEELLYDNAFGLENYLLNEFVKSIANAEEQAFMTGSGSGRPLGIFTQKTKVVSGVTYDTNAQFAVPVTTKTTGGTVNVDLKLDDVIDLIYTLKREYRQKAAFILNDKTIAAVRKIKDGNGAYIWQPSYQMGEPDKICGFAAHTSQYAPDMPTTQPSAATGNIGFMAFGDFSYYNIGDRGVRSIQTLKELFAGNGMVGYVIKERVDGMLVLPEAVQILYAQAAS